MTQFLVAERYFSLFQRIQSGLGLKQPTIPWPANGSLPRGQLLQHTADHYSLPSAEDKNVWHYAYINTPLSHKLSWPTQGQNYFLYPLHILPITSLVVIHSWSIKVPYSHSYTLPIYKEV
jgi:hypothetical protein